MNNFQLTPEKIIAAFLEIFENRAEIFSESARNNLSNLNIKITKLKARPNQEVADAIRDWCRNYPIIAERVLDLAERKPKPKPTEPSQQEGILTNCYPELPANLRKRINSSATEKSPSE